MQRARMFRTMQVPPQREGFDDEQATCAGSADGDTMIGFLIIGILAGWLAGYLMKGEGFGILGNLVLGVVGAFVGGFALRLIGFAPAWFIGELISATLGAVILIYLGRILRKS